MRAIYKGTVTVVAYFFIVLFVYAAVSKMRDFENFQVQLVQSPLLSAYAGFISYGVILLELMIALILAFPKGRKVGLYVSFGLMGAFTVYIYLILNYSDFVPCSCGGILEKMGWTEHLIFNVGSVVIAFVAIVFMEKEGAIHFGRTAAASSLILVISVGVMVALFLSSEHIIKKENNFTRRFLKHGIVQNKSVTLDDSDFYFAGNHQGYIYLGNRKYPQRLTIIDSTLSIVSILNIKPEKMQYKFRNIEVQVNYPYFYFYDGAIPIIYRGVLPDPEAHIISYQDAYFNQLSIIDTANFAVRTQSSSDKEFIIGHLGLAKRAKFNFEPGILQRQKDGVFDSDGVLLRDQMSEILVYIYSYRNEFIVMDTAMTVIRRLNTIDTTHTAKVKTIALSDGRNKMDGPSLKVNLKAVLYRGILFNQSNLMGRYESTKAWKKNVVIDVYETNSQFYGGSFYIHKKDGNAMKDFIITDHYLYVLLGDEIIQYTIRSPILKYFKKGVAENPNIE